MITPECWFLPTHSRDLHLRFFVFFSATSPRPTLLLSPLVIQENLIAEPAGKRCRTDSMASSQITDIVAEQDDMVIKVDQEHEATTIRINSNVLKIAPPVFRVMLNDNFAEGSVRLTPTNPLKLEGDRSRASSTCAISSTIRRASQTPSATPD